MSVLKEYVCLERAVNTTEVSTLGELSVLHTFSICTILKEFSLFNMGLTSNFLFQCIFFVTVLVLVSCILYKLCIALYGVVLLYCIVNR